VTICYQILYTGILDHLRNIATIKAIGYDDRVPGPAGARRPSTSAVGASCPGLV